MRRYGLGGQRTDFLAIVLVVTCVPWIVILLLAGSDSPRVGALTGLGALLYYSITYLLFRAQAVDRAHASRAVVWCSLSSEDGGIALTVENVSHVPALNLRIFVAAISDSGTEDVVRHLRFGGIPPRHGIQTSLPYAAAASVNTVVVYETELAYWCLARYRFEVHTAAELPVSAYVSPPWPPRRGPAAISEQVPQLLDRLLQTPVPENVEVDLRYLKDSAEHGVASVDAPSSMYRLH